MQSIRNIRWMKDLPEGFKGADITTELCGVKMQSPLILSSGPLSFAAEGLIRAHECGAGAVVTKTIRKQRAVNPVPHIAMHNNDSLINCEKWADSDPEVWFEREIPMTKAAGAVVIASVGHTLPEAEAIVAKAEAAGADFIELVSYTELDMIPMLKATLERVSIPIICKLSANWADPVGCARTCLELGASAIAAIDSIGPTLKVDIYNKRPAMGSADGYGWMSGGAMRPIAMRINSEIARNAIEDGIEDLNLYGIGGVTNAEDLVEFLMVGCKAVGVCSIAIIKGIEYYTKLCKDLSVLLKQLGYNSLTEAVGAALPAFKTQFENKPHVGEREQDKESDVKFQFKYDPDYSPCQAACPAGVDAALYIDQVRRGDYIGAYKTVSHANPLVAICGRVCDHPCEAACRRGFVDEPISIRLLKRAAADETFMACGSELPIPELAPYNGKNIAIVGSGPAGLSAAYYMAKGGYGVKIFEALPVAGGMLAVGIPDYRLPKDILNLEIGRIESMGVEIRTGVKVGTDVTMDQLKEQYDGVIVALGAHGDPNISLEGKESGNVLSGVSFLRDVNLSLAGSMKGKKVVVVGGGNVAIDAARSALRLSADEVTVVYRRDEEAMPAYAEEIAHAKEEGVAYKFLAAPAKVDGNKFYYSPMKLGAVDASGRRSPEATGEADVAIDADIVILATGQTIVGDFIPNVIDMNSGKSVEAGVYVAGDCATGPKSVIEAVAGGRRSAEAIDYELGGSGDLKGELEANRMHFIDLNDDVQGRVDGYFIDVEDRVPGFNEVELGLLEDDDRKEASRCMHCGCINCMRCVEACSYDARQLDFPIMTVDRDLCRNCGVCISSCPTGALSGIIVDKFSETDNTQNYLGLFS